MEKIKVAIVGLGNVGFCVLDSVLLEPDMELVGVVDLMSKEQIKTNSSAMRCSILNNINFVNDISELEKVDVAIVSCPSRMVKDTVSKLLKLGINTVDSFDIHTEIVETRRAIDAVAKENNAVSIISAGWDPGVDSVVRAWFMAMAPRGLTQTNFGPGMSMGHSVAAKSKAGVKNALSITVPVGMGVHRRMVYVELLPDANFEEVQTAIRTDPYFSHDETYVFKVDCVADLIDMGHGVSMERKGVSGTTQNQLMKFELRVNNPALTAQTMVSSARATLKQKPGCYTLIEIPAIDLLSGNLEDFVSKLV